VENVEDWKQLSGASRRRIKAADDLYFVEGFHWFSP
jgi:hypothetical protein